MKKPTNAELVAALRSDDPVVREEMALRLEQKRPAHRQHQPNAPYNRAALLGVLFSFLKNAEDVRGLHAGVMPLAGLPFDLEYADELIVRLEPLAAKNMASAIRMTIDWFGNRGIVVKKSAIEKILYDYCQREDNTIETPAQWENFKKKQLDEFEKHQIEHFKKTSEVVDRK